MFIFFEVPHFILSGCSTFDLPTGAIDATQTAGDTIQTMYLDEGRGSCKTQTGQSLLEPCPG